VLFDSDIVRDGTPYRLVYIRLLPERSTRRQNTKLYTTAQQKQTERSRITVTTAASQRKVQFNTLCAINKLRTQHALSMSYSSFRGLKISWKICTFVHARSPSCSVLTPCRRLHEFNISLRPDIKTNFDVNVILELLTSLPCPEQMEQILNMKYEHSSVHKAYIRRANIVCKEC